MPAIENEDLILPEQLTFDNVMAFHDMAKNCIETSSSIVLDYSNIRKIDVSGYQLVLSIHKTAEKLGKTVVTKNISQDIEDVISRIGFVYNQ